MAFRKIPSSSGREELASTVLRIADALEEADLVKCHALVLRYASSPQKIDILKKAVMIYGLKVDAGQSLLPDDLIYFREAWGYMYGDEKLKKPLVALMKEIMAKDGMIPSKEKSIWEIWLSRW